jgi:mannose-6-phosphate isomerase-like protein (cupin superfamily)
MADYTVKRVEDFEAVFGGGFKRVRAGLGVTSFGLALIDLPPNYANYPLHTQEHDSQEEVYTVVSGRATLEIGQESVELEPGVWVRVGPSEPRRLVTGDEPVSVIAIGGVLGGVYQAPDFTEEGAPDPAGHKKMGVEPLT